MSKWQEKYSRVKPCLTQMFLAPVSKISKLLNSREREIEKIGEDEDSHKILKRARR